MNKFLLLTNLVILTFAGNSQLTGDTIKNKLQQLNKPTRVLPKYVNFDVLKLFMLGHGRSPYKHIEYGTGFSFRIQLLSPYALWKYNFPVAFGITFGSSKLTARSTNFGFDGNNLVSVTEDRNIQSTVQRTGYIGATALKVIRVKPWAMTILTGGSVEYNLISKLRIRKADEDQDYSSRKYINRLSVPLHLQISFSGKQFISYGLFGSYDVRPRFRGNNFNTIKQVVIGLSLVAFII